MRLGISLNYGLFCVLAAFGFLKASPSFATTCSNQPIREEILREFAISLNGEVLSPQSANTCDMPSTVDSLLESLIFIKQHAVLAAPSPLFNQNIIGDNAWTFLKQIRRIDLLSADHELCQVDAGSKGITMAAADLTIKSVGICPRLFSLAPVNIASVLMHEARHLNGSFSHSACIWGENPEGCDESYEDHGAYAVEIEYGLRLLRDLSLNSIERELLKWQILETAINHFNIRPLNLATGLMAQDENGQLWLFDGNRLQSVKGGGPYSRLARRGSWTTLFDTQLGDLKIIVGPRNDLDIPIAKLFRKILGHLPKEKLVDVSFGNPYLCLLFTTQLICLNPKGSQPSTLSLSKIEPLSLLNGVRSATLKDVGFQLVTKDGRAYPLPIDFAEFTRLSEQQLLARSWHSEILAVQPRDRRHDYVLTRSGKVLLRSAGQDNFQAISAFDGINVRAISGSLIIPKALKDELDLKTPFE